MSGGVRALGPTGEAAAAAELFDALACGGPAVRAHFGRFFEVVAGPGEPLAAPVAAGDVLVCRALAEGGLASASPVGQDWDPGPRLRLDQMVVRPRLEDAVEATDWPEVLDLGEQVVRTGADYKKWVQASLNIVLGRRLPVDGNLAAAATQAAIRSFQAGRGLDVDGKTSPATERALTAALLELSAPAPRPPGAPAPPAACLAVPLVPDPSEATPAAAVGTLDLVAPLRIPIPFLTSLAVTFNIRVSVVYPASVAGAGAPFTTNPAFPGRRPIVFLAHSTHEVAHDPANRCNERGTNPGGWPEIPNYKGYDYFQQKLARLGIVTASVDCNIANEGGLSPTNIALRALFVATAIRHFQTLDTGHPILARRLDFAKIGLFGHSRGGEAMLKVAEDHLLPASPHRIEGATVEALFALAPSDTTAPNTGSSGPATSGVPRGFAFATLLPAGDGDVLANHGARLYDRAAADPFKCQLYIHNTNHNFFSRESIRDDRNGPAVVPRALHEGILAAYGCAFFRAALLGDTTDVLSGRALPTILIPNTTTPLDVPRFVHISFEAGPVPPFVPPVTVDDHENRNIDLNRVGMPTTRIGGLIAGEYDFSEDGAQRFNGSFFGATVGMVAESASPTGTYRSALKKPTDLTGREVWVRAAEVYNGQNVSGGRTGFLLGLEDDRKQVVLVDSDRVGGLPRPYDRRADDLLWYPVDYTKSMLKTLRFPATCFAGAGFRLTHVVALLIRLDREDGRAVAFDQLQIV